jgi:diphosphomevalonate decarboxylase
MSTATAVAPANIAFVKYWGVQNAALTLPLNESVSMNLDRCLTTTTVCFDPRLNADNMLIKLHGEDERPATGSFLARVVAQLDRVRALAGVETRAHIRSENNFPADAGIASSAAGFAALTTAAVAALGLDLDERALSILTRQSGSGSACRSIPTGFTHWRNDGTDAGSYAVSIAPPEHWALADVVAVVNTDRKRVSSADNHRRVQTSPYLPVRLAEVPGRIEQTLRAIGERDLQLLGRICEADAVSLHVIAMTAQPPTFYWQPGTMAVIQALQQWRAEGLLGYFTIDAGPNMHVICDQRDAAEIEGRLQALPEVEFTIMNGPGEGARILDVGCPCPEGARV